MLPPEVLSRLPWTKAERALHEATMALARLSDDPDEIAETLEWKGVVGALGTKDRGPLINYLKRLCGDMEIEIRGNRFLVLDQLPNLAYPKTVFFIRLGRRLRRFVENFEAKKYPQLIG
jgi:hypothetical protein